LDRDGTILVDPAYLHEPERVRFLPGSAEAIHRLNAAGILVVTVSNQSGMPAGVYGGGQLRDRIKTHHNVAGLPADMKLKLVEPLRDLYKDEVRAVARTLGVRVAERQPFPGPGLAVRIVGEVTPESAAVVREASAIVEHEIEVAAKDRRLPLPWQYFAVLLPVQTVGVHGDLRVYGKTIVVRAVDSIDGMTATYSKIPHDVLDRISIRITNEVPGINRVVYDVSNKPPATIEWE